MINNGSNPYEMFNQITKGNTPEQINKIFDIGKQMGISDDVINKIQSGINTK